jgi:hypothetical protein
MFSVCDRGSLFRFVIPHKVGLAEYARKRSGEGSRDIKIDLKFM